MKNANLIELKRIKHYNSINVVVNIPVRRFSVSYKHLQIWRQFEITTLELMVTVGVKDITVDSTGDRGAQIYIFYYVSTLFDI